MRQMRMVSILAIANGEWRNAKNAAHLWLRTGKEEESDSTAKHAEAAEIKLLLFISALSAPSAVN